MRDRPISATAPAVFSYVQCSAYLGLSSVGALRNMVHRRSAPPSIAYGKRDRRFRRSDVDAWLEGKSRDAQAENVIAAAQQPPTPRRRGRPTKAEAFARRLREGRG